MQRTPLLSRGRRRPVSHHLPEGTGLDMADQVTFAQAAEILSCHVSNIPKLIASGHLIRHHAPGRIRGHLLRADVEALAEARAAAAAAPQRGRRRRRPVIDHRPDPSYDWLTPTQAGRIIGITAQGVHKRIRRQTLPAVQHDGRWWIRRDHLELVEQAHAARRTRQP